MMRDCGESEIGIIRNENVLASWGYQSQRLQKLAVYRVWTGKKSAASAERNLDNTLLRS